MAQKSITEYSAKKLLISELPKYLPGYSHIGKVAEITSTYNWEELVAKNPWFKTGKLVAKPDQLFGKRGLHNLLLLDATFDELKGFIDERMGKEFEINGVKGTLDRFLVEKFVPHEKEFLISIHSERDRDIIHFSTEGGINVEENWDKVTSIPVPIGTKIDDNDLAELLPDLEELSDSVIQYIKGLFQVYVNQDFTFLEINPLAITDDKKIVPLDLKAKLDDTAAFRHLKTWGKPDNPLKFPSHFGHSPKKEEESIQEIDAKTGASLKLSILNREGRIWTMVAGGGASVIYADTVVDMGFGHELANYGEYSGNPTREHTEIYAQTIIDLITERPDPEGKSKVLIIGGGIANFTDVKATFAGIISALEKSATKLKAANVCIYVRRGGPNEKEGLELMKKVGEELGLPMIVCDRYTPMTRIVPLALKEIN